MRHLILSAVAWMSTSVLAAPLNGLTVDQPICYGREYSTTHMTSHPLQTVKQMKAKFTKEADSAGVFLQINADIAQDKVDADGTTYKTLKPYATRMWCNPKADNGFECSIDCDGGSAKVNFGVKQNADVITLKNEGFVLYGGCGEESEEIIFLTATKHGDDIFKLFKLRTEFCQK